MEEKTLKLYSKKTNRDYKYTSHKNPSDSASAFSIRHRWSRSATRDEWTWHVSNEKVDKSWQKKKKRDEKKKEEDGGEKNVKMDPTSSGRTSCCVSSYMEARRGIVQEERTVSSQWSQSSISALAIESTPSILTSTFFRARYLPPTTYKKSTKHEENEKQREAEQDESIRQHRCIEETDKTKCRTS